MRGNHKFCTLLAHYLLHSTLYGWVVVVGCFFFIVPKASETQTTTIIKQALRSRQNATGRKVAHVRIACKSNNFNKQIVERKKNYQQQMHGLSWFKLNRSYLGKIKCRARLLFAQNTSIIWLSLYGKACVPFFKKMLSTSS